MGKIFCLLGKSNSGKDTIFKQLINDISLKLQPLVPYTTRPIRKNEQQGFEYFFITEEDLKLHRKRGKIIEQRDYETINGVWSYCTIDDGKVDLEGNNYYLLITTLQAFKELKDYFGADNVIPIYIEVEGGVRLERALYREREQANPNYDELCRRFLADSNDFSDSQLRYHNIVKSYLNHNLSKCIKSIKADIRKNQK